MAKAKYARGKDGYFQAKVWDGTYTNGKKNRMNLRTKTSSAALEKMVIEHNHKLREREYIIHNSLSFFEYSLSWLEIYKAGRALNTKNMYLYIINKYLSQITCKVSDLKRIHYFAVLNSIEAPRAAQQYSMTFKQVLKSAIRDRLLPASLLDDIFDGRDAKVRYKAPEKRGLLDHERQAVFDAVLKPSDRAFLYILYGCGLRRGEALALTRFDVSIERRELTVNKSVAFDQNKPYIKAPKSSHGYRTVPIPDSVYDGIVDYIQTMRGPQLFTTAAGGLMTRMAYRLMWDRIVQAMQAVSTKPIEGLTAHIFRHNYCSSLCYMLPEISIRQIAQLLGDTDQMVLEVYNHILDSKKDSSAVIAKALAF